MNHVSSPSGALISHVSIEAFTSALDEIASLRNAPLSGFSRGGARIFLDAFNAALTNGVMRREHPVHFQAAPGAGKSTSAIAAIVALARQRGSCVVATPTTDLCDATAAELRRFLGDCVAAWHREAAGEIEPADLDRFPVAVVTHAFLVGTRGGLARTYLGQPRDATLIDERMDQVEVFEVGLSQVASAHDTIQKSREHRDDPTYQRVTEGLAALYSGLADIWAPLPGDVHAVPITTEIVSERHIEGLRLFAESSSISIAGADGCSQVRGFVNALLGRRAFAAKHMGCATGGHFVGYSQLVDHAPGTLVLDATAHLDGPAAIARNRDLIRGPAPSYSRLQAITTGLPVAERLTGLTDSEKRALGSWLASLLVEHTKPGDNVLVISNKAVTDHKPIRTLMPPDRQIAWCNFGTGMGINTHRDCDTVIVLGDYMLAGRTALALTLGHQRRAVDVECLKPLQGRFAGSPCDYRDGEALRWFLQLALRGSARKLDQDGCAAPMKLIHASNTDLVPSAFDTLFGGAAAPEAVGEHPKKGGIAQRLMVALQEHASRGCTEVSSETLLDDYGVNLRSHKARLKENTTFMEFIERHGWSFKETSGRGNKGGMLKVLQLP
jgi:hypothetical protein